jgi:hypothetical protein
MVNEEIITALKNAVERGENLQTAMNILINSGYNLKEVQEASNFIGGTTTHLETKSHEHLLMPNDRRFSPQQRQQQVKFQPQVPYSQPQTSYAQQLQQTKQNFKEESSQIKQEVSRDLETKYQGEFISNGQSALLAQQLNKISPKKEGHAIEIILIIILLILVGILISTIVFKESLLQFFSKF